jgi:ferritin-like metal-binding protein YciE
LSGHNPELEKAMTTTRESLAAWLRDAHAMEGQAITLLETQIDRLESYPETVPRLRQHLAETKDQRTKVEQCLNKLGEDTSSLKDTTMKVGANLQGIMHMMSTDEVLKHALASNAFEHFEAASYCALAAAADDAGEPEIAQTCKQIMQQELAMADWVWAQLPPLTHKYLQLSEAGTGKR